MGVGKSGLLAQQFKEEWNNIKKELMEYQSIHRAMGDDWTPVEEVVSNIKIDELSKTLHQMSLNIKRVSLEIGFIE